MKYYFRVTETISKYIWVEAEDAQEAEDIALETIDLDKNPDYYEREATLMEMENKGEVV